MTHTAVGRRVLQLVLLVGGLFVVGLLCGGQAQAADGVLGKPVSLGSPGIPVAAPVVKPVPHPVSVPAPISVPVPVLAPVVAPVSDIVERVVRPVSDVVTKTVTAVLAEAPSLPLLPTLPSLSTLPSVPVVPSQAVPPVQTPPVQAPPTHTAPVPTPVRSTPQSSSGGHRTDARPAEMAVGVGAAYGPRFVVAADALNAVGHAVMRHAPSVRPAPAPQVPTGDPDGALRDQQAMDSGSSRHCDVQAVTLGNRVAVRFVPGVAARAGVPETRDRYRDVPVFPG
ncbi:hypothetical protein [Streptomyces sp. NPDC101776]|uniref:hypothetical protein n=1 Tax=Streptomyces sp. NPDC101776 TaxID=3366146 RepID=UPI0037F39A0B